MSQLKITGVLGLLMLTSTACMYDFDKFRPTRSDLDYTQSWDAQRPADMKTDMPPRVDMSSDMSTADMKTDMPRQDMSSDMPKDASDMTDASMDMSTDATDMTPDQTNCGNGTVDPGETCDGDCPTSCDDSNACTTDTLTGDATTCDAMCSTQEITACAHDDGCCPAGCDYSMDNDCAIDCTDPSTWPASWAALETEMMGRINDARNIARKCGTFNAPRSAPFRLEPEVVQAARCHALDMAQRKYLHANSPPPENATPQQRLQDAGFAASTAFFLVTDKNMQDLVLNQWLAEQLPCFIIMGTNLTHGAVGYASTPDAPHRFAILSATKSN